MHEGILHIRQVRSRRSGDGEGFIDVLGNYALIGCKPSYLNLNDDLFAAISNAVKYYCMRLCSDFRRLRSQSADSSLKDPKSVVIMSLCS